MTSEYGAHVRQLPARLTALDANGRAAFAALCAERLLPYYRWFHLTEHWGSLAALSNAIELAWRCVVDPPVSAQEIAEARAAVEAATPDSEDFRSGLASRALDASAAASYALQCRGDGSVDSAVAAGEVAWEAAFGSEQTRLLRDPSVAHIAVPSDLAAAGSGSLVITEEDHQDKSLTALRSVDAWSVETAHNLRRRFGSPLLDA
ncbi:MAG TPA: DUF416 family protein [Candidatus Acidoferrum sp.]|jgi:uncharacterized protein YjaG (DUF416 family)|nr:DUF416 family protein [Candidatus Acidoferrum sp.]